MDPVDVEFDILGDGTTFIRRHLVDEGDDTLTPFVEVDVPRMRDRLHRDDGRGLRLVDSLLVGCGLDSEPSKARSQKPILTSYSAMTGLIPPRGRQRVR